MMVRQRWRFEWFMRLCSCCVLCAYGLICQFATAQIHQPWAPHEEVLVSQITDETIDLLSKTLSLSQEQVAAVKRLLEQHRARFKEFADKNRPIKKELDAAIQTTKGQEYLRVLFDREEQLAAIADQQNQLDADFLSSVRSLLAESQQSRWPELELRFNRIRWRGVPYLYGEEHLELTAILDQMSEVTPEPFENVNVQEQIASYSHEMNAVLRSSAAHYVAESRTLDRAKAKRFQVDGDQVFIGSDPNDVDQKKFFHDRHEVMQLHRRVRDVNRKYRDIFASLLPEQLRSTFEQHYMEGALKGLIRIDHLPGEAFVKAALALDQLSQEQKAGISALYDVYKEQARQNHRAILAAEQELAESNYRPAASVHERADLQKMLNDKVAGRIALEQRLIEDVWTLLDETQRMALPKPEVKAK